MPNNKTTAAYEKLEGMIIFQELAPGSMVTESQLIEMTGIGRTPIREALQRLSWERMVEIIPRKGIHIPIISVEVQLKLLELRRTVEELAVRLATHRATTEQKQAMLEQVQVMEKEVSPKQYAKILKRVHELVVQAAGNEYMQLAMAPLQGLSRRFWFAHLKEVEKELVGAAELHCATLRAICHGDEQAASAASLALNDYLTDFAYKTLTNR